MPAAHLAPSMMPYTEACSGPPVYCLFRPQLLTRV